MATSAKRVAIVGAGVAGLASLKQCLAEGIEADVFEGRSEIGGQWAYQEGPDESGNLQSSVYAGAILNSCRDTTAFSDFPLDPARYGDYFGHRKMLEYIHEYADHFGLLKHIRFRTNVLQCSQTPTGTWKVRFQKAGCSPEEMEYDALMAASGLNTAESIPDWKGKESFQGEFLHSHYYRKPGRFEGKKVVVVGLGSTAVDVASELAVASKEVHMIARRGAWVIPRYALGKPAEAWDNRATQIWVPGRVSEYIQTMLIRFIQGQQPEELRADHRLMQQSPTIRTEFIEQIRHGSIQVHRTNVESFTETGVVLSNGETLEADVVIAATGFKRDYSYLPADVLRAEDTPKFQVDVYKLVVPMRYRNLYLVGYLETFGPLLPAVEAQARYITGAITGRFSLPTEDVLIKGIHERQARQSKMFINSERHDCLEHYIAYVDDLMSYIGAKPTVGKLLAKVFTSGSPLKALSTLNGVFFGITSSAHWRLFGHGSNEDLARETTIRTAAGAPGLSKREKELLGI